MPTLTGKILHFGWGTPTPVQIKATITTMTQIPFDGLVIDLDKNIGPINTSTKFSWRMWGPTVILENDYTLAIAALQTTPFGRFTDNFLRVNVTPGVIDWFDPQFTNVCTNAQLAASIVKKCTMRGIFFDVEAYQGKLWEYPAQALASSKSFAEYQAQVRLCGKQWMTALRTGYTDCKVLLAYGYYLAHRPPIQGGTLATSKNGLLPSFIDGMLDALPLTLQSTNILYDGWESAYGYKSEQEFITAYDMIYQANTTRWYGPGCQVKFRQNYRCAYGLWIDYRSQTTYAPWNETDFTKNYFTPSTFEQSLRLALRYTDRYVWVYNNIDWWTGHIPQAYVDTLTAAKVI